jgi:ribosomal-protein-alanine N-acetyltransferase
MSAASTSQRPPAASPRILETERLVLRPFRESDAEAVYAYGCDPQVTRFLLWDTHRSIEDSADFLRFAIEERTFEGDEASWIWAIVLRGAADRPIGSIGLHIKRWRHGRASAGYAIGRPHWGQGYTAEALRRVLEFGFGELGLNRIEALHYLGNDASGRVMQKAGMQYEGVLRNYHFCKGEYRDAKIYAILRRDWDGKTLPPPEQKD